MIKVAVIGIGSMGKNHARIYANHDQVELVAVADMDVESLEKISHRFNTKGYTDYMKMLECEEIDAVSIAVPTRFHHAVALEVIKQRKHILLEKPIALTQEESKEIIDAAKKYNVILMIGHIARFNPAIIELKRRISQVGEIYKIDVQRIGPFPRRVADVGVTIDLSVHDLDIIEYLLQETPIRIYAESQQRLHPKHEDSLTALLTYPKGTLAVLNINYLSPTKTRLLKVFGERGMFMVNYLTQELYFYENKAFTTDNWQSVSEGDVHKINILKKEPLLAEVESFLKSIKNGGPSPVSGESGLSALSIAHCIIESSEKKSVVVLRNFSEIEKKI